MKRLGYIIYDVAVSSLIMIGLGLLCAPVTLLVWNSIIISHFPDIKPLNVADAVALNFGLNFVFYFKLTKRDVIVADQQLINEDLDEEIS